MSLQTNHLKEISKWIESNWKILDTSTLCSSSTYIPHLFYHTNIYNALKRSKITFQYRIIDFKSHRRFESHGWMLSSFLYDITAISPGNFHFESITDSRNIRYMRVATSAVATKRKTYKRSVWLHAWHFRCCLYGSSKVTSFFLHHIMDMTCFLLFIFYVRIFKVIKGEVHCVVYHDDDDDDIKNGNLHTLHKF